MATPTKATVEDVLRLGAQGERYELIDGELVPMSPTGPQHGKIETHVAWLLYSHVLPRQIGAVFTGEVLFRLDLDRGIARAPDVAFVRQEQLEGRELTGAFVGAPDLAVEIVSPGDSAKDIQRKVDDWLSHGTTVVLVMYPATRTVVPWRSDRAAALHGDDVVDLDDAVPGFQCRASDLFPPAV